MRYLVTLFWCFILGQVVGYLGTSLSGGLYDFKLTTIVSMIVGLLIILIAHVALPNKHQA